VSVEAAAPARQPGAPAQPPAPLAPATRLLHGILVNAASLAIGTLGALFPILVARLLGQAALGVFALAWAATDLLSKGATFGLDQGTTALVAQRAARGDGAGVGAVFRAAVATGLVLSALIGGAAWAGLGLAGTLLGQAPETVAAQRLMLLALPGVALYRISNGASRGLGIMKHDALSGGLAENLAAVAALVVLVAMGLHEAVRPIRTPVLAAVIGFSAGGLTAYVLARRAVRRAEAGRRGGNAAGLLRLSATLAATGFFNLAVMRMDVLVLGLFVGRAPGLTAAAFGVYCAAAEVAGVTRKVRQASEAPFLHGVATAAGSARREQEADAIGAAARWVLAALLLVGGVAAVGGPVLLEIFGPGFATGAAVLALLVVAHSAGSYSGLAENVLLVRRPQLNLVNSGVAAAAYLALCLALVPRLGAPGAAIAAVVAHAGLAAVRFGELRWLGVAWSWRRLRGIAAGFLLALAAAVVIRFAVPGAAGAALAAAAFAVMFAGRGLGRAFDVADRAALLALVPALERSRPASRALAPPERHGVVRRPAVGATEPLGVVLVVSSEDDGGAARSVYLLARDLPRFGVRPVVAIHREGPLSRRLAGAGIPFEVVAGLPEDLTRRHGRPASLRAIPGNLRGLSRCAASLRDLAQRRGAALLYGQGTWANLLCALAAAGSELGAVWHIRNDHRPPLKRLVMRTVAGAWGVRAVVAVSRSAAAPYEGLPLPLAVVHNGSDLYASDAARRAPVLRAHLALPAGAVLAGYAGRLLPHKGIHVLMDAARRAMRRSADLHLVVLGGNPEHTGEDVVARLRRQASAWGLADRIHLTGWVPDVERFLADLDLVVVPSTYPECGSRALVESLCLGVPVVASRVGGNPELLREGEEGLLVRPGDAGELAEALVRLAGDVEERGRMRAGALAAGRRFDSVEVARRVAEVLRAAAQSGEVR